MVSWVAVEQKYEEIVIALISKDDGGPDDTNTIAEMLPGHEVPTDI
jgi:hypothetical protein